MPVVGCDAVFFDLNDTLIVEEATAVASMIAAASLILERELTLVAETRVRIGAANLAHPPGDRAGGEPSSWSLRIGWRFCLRRREVPICTRRSFAKVVIT
jgi:hypothetical protein